MKWIIPLVALSLAAPAFAQRTEGSSEDRDELRELRRQLAETQRQLNDMNRRLGSLDTERRDRRTSRFPSRSSLFVSREPRPMLGVVLGNSDDGEGVPLTDVTPDAPAERAGLKGGDVITAVNGVRLSGSAPLQTLLDELGDIDEGDQFELTYERKGREYTVSLEAEMRTPSYAYRIGPGGLFGRDGDFQFQVGQNNYAIDMDNFKDWAEGQRDWALKLNRQFRPGQLGPGGSTLWNFGLSWSALQLAELNPSLARYFGVTEGVLVVDSQLEDGPLQGGDVLMNIGGMDVRSIAETMDMLSQLDAGETVDVVLVRDGNRQEVSLTAPKNSFYDFSFGFATDN